MNPQVVSSKSLVETIENIEQSSIHYSEKLKEEKRECKRTIAAAKRCMEKSAFATITVPDMEDVENLLMIDIPKLPKPVREEEKGIKVEVITLEKGKTEGINSQEIMLEEK